MTGGICNNVVSFGMITWLPTYFTKAKGLAIIQRIIPRQIIGAGTGIYNGMAMLIGGGAGPVLVGTIVSATGSYTSGIAALSGVLVVGAAAMLILGRQIRY